MDSLATKRLVLEPLVAAHAREMFGLLSDPAIYRHLDCGPPASVESLRDRYSRLARRRSADGGEIWLNWIVRLHNREPLGYVQATIMGDDTAYVAYVLASRFWGHGYASEATAAMLEYLDAKYVVARFLAVVETANARSTSLLERLGFTLAPPQTAERKSLSPTERLYERRRAPRAMGSEPSIESTCSDIRPLQTVHAEGQRR